MQSMTPPVFVAPLTRRRAWLWQTASESRSGRGNGGGGWSRGVTTPSGNSAVSQPLTWTQCLRTSPSLPALRSGLTPLMVLSQTSDGLVFTPWWSCLNPLMVLS